MKKMSLALSVFLLLFLTSCTKKEEGSSTAATKKKPSFAFKNTGDNLQELFIVLNQAVTEGDHEKGAELTRSLMPTPEQLKVVLNSSVTDEQFDALKTMHKNYAIPAGVPAETVAKTLIRKPKQTIIQVHKATTEDLIAYAKGSAAYNEFPGGARTLAQKYFKPNTTFYEVEMLEPGAKYGMKYHLFFWNGSSWSMFGPGWRVLK